MIRVIHQCEVCTEERKLSNGWIMATVSGTLNQVNFFPWNTSKEKNKKIKHLCSGDCQSKFLLRITENWGSGHDQPSVQG